MAAYNPYRKFEAAEEGLWLKCNFHVHDNSYDNVKFASLDPVFEQYKACGYDIIMISSQTEFEDTLEIAKKYNMCSIAGEEYAEVDGFLLVGIKDFINGTPQEAIKKCIDNGGFVVACHPHMSDLMTQMMPGKFTTPDLIKQIDGLIGVEIVNGAIGRMHMPQYQTTLGKTMATDTWDDLLLQGKKLWGFGSDDSHTNTEIDRAWTMIYARSTSFEDIKESVTEGCLYVSTGLFLNEFTLNENKVCLEANYPFVKEKILYKMILDGTLTNTMTSERASFDIPEFKSFVRFEAVAPNGDMLWTQPLIKE